MKTLLLWCVLLVLCWPVAILALVLWPLIWLLSLPLRLIGISFEAIFALLRAILFLPARVLGYRDNSARRALYPPRPVRKVFGELPMISAREGLALLREGNRRFVSESPSRDAVESRARRLELATGQQPFAAILGCSDSRVPVEIVFDQGLGDLFVIRVAGNIVAPSLIGSVEFAAEQFHTRLVIVLGHTRCGAIETTLEQLQRPVENQSRNLHSIVDFIRPAVQGLLTTNLKNDHEALVREACRANIRASVNHLRHGSEIIENLIQNAGLLVVGAEYSLETGVVDFFDHVS